MERQINFFLKLYNIVIKKLNFFADPCLLLADSTVNLILEPSGFDQLCLKSFL